MKNIERLARYTTKYGKESFLIHSIPRTNYWLVCQRIGKDRWSLILEDPLGTVSYNLGVVTDAQHLEIWMRLINVEAKNYLTQRKMVEDYKSIVNNYIKKYNQRMNKKIKQK